MGYVPVSGADDTFDIYGHLASYMSLEHEVITGGSWETSIADSGSTSAPTGYVAFTADNEVYLGLNRSHSYSTTAFVHNDDGTDMDFRVESDDNTHMIFVDGGSDHVNIGTSSDLGGMLNVAGPAVVSYNSGDLASLTIQDTGTSQAGLNIKAGSGSTNRASRINFFNNVTSTSAPRWSIISDYFQNGNNDFTIVDSAATKFLRITSNHSSDGVFILNEDSDDVDFRIESDAQSNAFFLDANNNGIFIGKNTDNLTLQGSSFSNLNAGHHYFTVVNTHDGAGSACAYFNRQNADGSLIEFRQQNVAEGTISVSGSTVSYNGFSGRHESSGIATNTAVGTVVSTIDELDVYPNRQGAANGVTEPNPKAGQTRADHAKVKVSDAEGDSCVYGVVSEFTEQDKVVVTSVGIGSVRVTGACSKGDLLESNGDGTAKVQSDDIVRSKTIGKVTIGNSNTGVKLVACVMYCG